VHQKVKTLPCKDECILKLKVVSVPERKIDAQVKIQVSQDSDAVGLKGLVGRELSMDFGRHAQREIIGLCLDLAKVYCLDLDARVSVTRAIRDADFHLNRLTFLEIENIQPLIQHLREAMPAAQESMLQALSSLVVGVAKDESEMKTI
jgi:hypothetical protein